MLKPLLDLLLDLFLPQRCPACAALAAPAGACARCLTPLASQPRLVHPHPRPPTLPQTWATAPYRPPTSALLLAYKEQTRTALQPPLSQALAQSLQQACTSSLPSEADILVAAVPSSGRVVRRRGHDPLRGLADEAVRLSQAAGFAMLRADALRHRRRTADQAGLRAAVRTANLAGALVADPAVVAGRTVLLVDDVITTGATLAEATRALRAAGAHVPAAAAIAATPRHTPTHARATNP